MPPHRVAATVFSGWNQDSVSDNPYTILKMNHRRVVFAFWVAIVVTALFAYFFHRDLLQRLLSELSASPPFWIYALYVALGCVLRGETTHYDIVSGESARGLMDLTLKGLCIGNGILTCENEAQAWPRAKTTEGDKGSGAADTALAMLRFKRARKKNTTR